MWYPQFLSCRLELVLCPWLTCSHGCPCFKLLGCIVAMLHLPLPCFNAMNCFWQASACFLSMSFLGASCPVKAAMPRGRSKAGPRGRSKAHLEGACNVAIFGAAAVPSKGVQGNSSITFKLNSVVLLLLPCLALQRCARRLQSLVRPRCGNTSP